MPNNPQNTFSPSSLKSNTNILNIQSTYLIDTTIQFFPNHREVLESISEFIHKKKLDFTKILVIKYSIETLQKLKKVKMKKQ